jgi:hypothetical protein
VPNLTEQSFSFLSAFSHHHHQRLLARLGSISRTGNGNVTFKIPFEGKNSYRGRASSVSRRIEERRILPRDFTADTRSAVMGLCKYCFPRVSFAHKTRADFDSNDALVFVPHVRQVLSPVLPSTTPESHGKNLSTFEEKPISQCHLEKGKGIEEGSRTSVHQILRSSAPSILGICVVRRYKNDDVEERESSMRSKAAVRSKQSISKTDHDSSL